ncbi:RNI-like protein [Coemansia reversa NRRL 1564]|uniref:RNI-like protein n=1 Tax=Coemansia reversa (strain ATCC 12441 / NRRL 1564) TaxID=763665 RepID=A0A2G5BJM7_COERN|nr:RNI-like protein [Coemansia reversa NRRL 1564]|eukprot:PIA19218.1 RNI-like protein [Coemansia reversa NRRL 1564]
MPDPVLVLPSNVVIDIFRNIPLNDIARCTLVSKHWFYSLSGWGVLWSVIDRSTWTCRATDLSEDGHNMLYTGSDDIHGFDSGIDRVNFRYQQHRRRLRDRDIWLIVRRAGPALTKLVLNLEIWITSTGIRSLIQCCCVNIRHLEIRANGNLEVGLLKELFTQIGARLETVVLVSVEVGNSLVRRLLLFAPHLKHLNLSYCWDVTCDAFPPTDSIEYQALAAPENYSGEENGSVKVGGSKSPQSLLCSSSSEIVWDSKTMANIKHRGNPRGTISLPKLETLRLCLCRDIDNSAIPRIIHTFGDSLLELDVSKTKVTLQGLCEIATSAKICNFQTTDSLHNTGKKDMHQKSGALNLHKLNIAYTKFSINANVLGVNMPRDLSLRSWGVSNFTAAVPWLTNLRIGGENKYVTNEFVEQLVLNLNMLTTIGIHDCEKLTDIALFSLATHCPKLEVTDIRLCNQFTDHGVIALVQSCRDLRELSLSGLQISDESLVVIGDTLRHLQILVLDMCQQITAEGIQSAVEGSDGLGCQFTLKKLTFADCVNLGADTVNWCRKRLSSDALVACMIERISFS